MAILSGVALSGFCNLKTRKTSAGHVKGVWSMSVKRAGCPTVTSAQGASSVVRSNVAPGRGFA
eukprot:6173627-Amphidinium_carterae.1